MRKFFFACSFSLIAVFGLFSCGTHDMFGDNETKMAKALQEALLLGSQTATINLGDSSCEIPFEKKECITGYLGNELVEIALPDDIKKIFADISSVASFASFIGISNLNSYRDSIIINLNRAAEEAAMGALKTFQDAVFGLSFSDAAKILRGDSVAATSYLKETTYSELQVNFTPIIKRPLDRLNLNKYWSPIASSYNSFASTLGSTLGSSMLPYPSLEPDISESLSNHAIDKALYGLFLMVGKQEIKLREDPLGAVREVGDLVSPEAGNLLSDVFGKAKHGLI